MRVVELDLENENFLVAGKHSGASRYFVWWNCDRRPLVLSDECPHRGGPLHLGEVNCPAGAITCPWHGMTWTEKALEQRSIPAVISGSRLTAILDEDPEISVRTYKTRIIANEHSAGSP